MVSLGLHKIAAGVPQTASRMTHIEAAALAPVDNVSSDLRFSLVPEVAANVFGRRFRP